MAAVDLKKRNEELLAELQQCKVCMQQSLAAFPVVLAQYCWPIHLGGGCACLGAVKQHGFLYACLYYVQALPQAEII